MPETRATMKGIPGDAARQRGLRRVLVPLTALALLFGLGLGAALGAALTMPWWVGVLAALAALAGLALFRRRQPSLVYGFFKGARGEEIVAGELAHLPASWTILNGLILPDGRDVDHVAIGPQGVFVIETKHWSGEVSVEDGRILANGRPIARSPIVQVRHAMAAIGAIAALPPGALHGVLCFAGRQFADGAVHVDEVLICSHLGLSAALTLGPAVLDATDLARCVARLGSLALTEGF